MNGTAADETMLRMVTRELMRSYSESPSNLSVAIYSLWHPADSGIEDGSIILYETSRVHTIHESGINCELDSATSHLHLTRFHPRQGSPHPLIIFQAVTNVLPPRPHQQTVVRSIRTSVPSR
jgi:hypothetical protein